MIYLDNAATTQVSDAVVYMMHKYMRDHYGNPGSLHSCGRDAKKALDYAHQHICSYIGAPHDDALIFTSGGSESNTMAICGIAQTLLRNRKTHIITTAIEHPSVLNAVLYLVENEGFDVTYLNPDNLGYVHAEDLKKAIRPDTGLVSVMAVNNELGTIQPIAEIGKICHEQGIYFHTDCVQAVGTVNLNVIEMNIDFLSLSGHKFHAPKGVGALYCKEKDVLRPIIFGGGQEYGLRSGTENIPGVVSMAIAMEAETLYPEHISKQIFIDRMNSLDCHVKYNGDTATNSSKIISVMVPGIDGQSLVLGLDSMGVCVSAGSACKSHSHTASHVLRAIGLTDDEALSSIRISLSRFTTQDELERCAEAICRITKVLKK